MCACLHTDLSEDLVLVLDDLHELPPDSDAAGIIETLCQRAPDRLHLVLISRRELPFSLQRLRGRGFVSEIHAPDIAFDLADVEALLHQTVGQDPPGLSRLIWEHTGGWPTAVQCAVEMLRGVEADRRPATVKKLCQPGERFHDYLAEEVLGTAPERERYLLRRMTILDEVSSTTEITLGLDDQTALLAELVRQGLVQRSGEDSAGWTLVRPLRDFFAHEATPSVNERKALHVTVATECIERGAPADALRHFVAAGDHAACAALLVDHGTAMVESGQLDAVMQAAELPSKYLDDPRVRIVLGQAQQVRGQLGQALQHFQHAGCLQDGLEPALSWRVGLIAFAEGKFADIQTLVRRTLMDRADTLDETRVLALSASAHEMTGDLMGLRRMACETRAAAQRCRDPRAWSSAHHVPALLAAAEGDWLQANIHLTEAQRSAEGTQDLLQLTWTWAWRAFHQCEAGAPRRALADAQNALNLGERCQNPFFIAHALTTRGRAHARLGMLEAAAGDFTTAIDLFQRLGSRFLAWPLCGLGDLYRIKDQLVRARAAYEEALTLADPYHDVIGLSSALTGLARIAAADDLTFARQCATRAMELGEGLRTIPALLTCGWVELISGDRERASADAHRATVAARLRRDDLGLAEAITLAVLASRNPVMDVAPLRDAIGIWHETGCRLEEAATRIVAANIGASIPHLDACLADRTLRDHDVDVESQRAAGPLGALVRTAPAVFIQTLGVFLVSRNGIPIPNNSWKSKKARDLLKIMVARRRPIPREQLMELLWPSAAPVVASNRLSVLLARVRDVLQPQPTGEEPLVTTDGALSLNPAQVRVDVEEFLAQATAALDADRADYPDATARLTAAAAAHTGDFLQDDPYQEWAGSMMEEVRAAYIALLRALTARLRQAGDTDAVVQCTLRLLDQDYYDEESHFTLIEVQLAAGHLGEARRHYHTYIRRMAEIGVRPRPLSEMMPAGHEKSNLRSGIKTAMSSGHDCGEPVSDVPANLQRAGGRR
jgi:DNA-binding SARP family transcriptional activator